MADIDKVKILVVGDSGVGKSSLTHLLTHKTPANKPTWTVGCSVEVKLHEYKEGTPQQKTYFIELWDVGGSSSHRNTRHVFYSGVHGVILVHDLTNRKSQENLQKWLGEVLNRDNNSKQKKNEEYDVEQFVGSSQIPVLVIGTKLDLVGESRSRTLKRSSFICDEYGADEIFLDCQQVRSIAPGTSSAVKCSRFFDKVIEVKYNYHIGDKRKVYFNATSPNKYFHND
ncbi:rab-like protein 3 [Planococcus citri]|uniref:rab-like protein 3 n=1 Tax=Planococcus citri TaxID=170843 RepID=UPI0031F7FAD1